MRTLLNIHRTSERSVNILVTRILLLCIFIIPSNSFAAPNINNCKSSWVLTNETPGMQFGDFSVDSGPGTITLNAGSTRTASVTIDLMSAGGAVSSHQMTIDNTRGQGCAAFGIEIAWVVDPEGSLMSGPGSDMAISNTTVYIAGEETTLSTGVRTDFQLPLKVEIVSTLTTASTQAAGTYTSPAYEIAVTQSNKTVSQTGTASAIAYTPLTLTLGPEMDFGTIASGSNATTVSVNAAGAVSAPPGAGNAVVTVAAGAPLTFNIQGANGLAYNLNIADGLLADGATGAAMPVTITGDDRPAVLDGTVQTVTATADLSVGANQSQGNYSTANGSPIVITLDYN